MNKFISKRTEQRALNTELIPTPQQAKLPFVKLNE